MDQYLAGYFFWAESMLLRILIKSEVESDASGLVHVRTSVSLNLGQDSKLWAFPLDSAPLVHLDFQNFGQNFKEQMVCPG